MFDRDGLSGILSGHEALIAAYSPPLDDPEMRRHLQEAVDIIIAATKSAGVKRLLMVGGAGSLEVASCGRVVDQPDFPEVWKPGSLGMRDVLDRLRRETDIEWTFLSPAERLQRGDRTAKFRLGGDQVMLGADGECRMSVQDYAVAMIDELEAPRHSRQRFCVAY